MRTKSNVLEDGVSVRIGLHGARRMRVYGFGSVVQEVGDGRWSGFFLAPVWVVWLVDHATIEAGRGDEGLACYTYVSWKATVARAAADHAYGQALATVFASGSHFALAAVCVPMPNDEQNHLALLEDLRRIDELHAMK